MIDTLKQKQARERVEADVRQARASKYQIKMNGENVTLPLLTPLRNLNEVEPVLRNSRAEYMRKYRKREHSCPHCGGKL